MATAGPSEKGGLGVTRKSVRLLVEEFRLSQALGYETAPVNLSSWIYISELQRKEHERVEVPT
jgi:hypothetical protein